MTMRRWLALAALAALAGCEGSHAEYPLSWPALVSTEDACQSLAGSYRDAGDWLRRDIPSGHAPAAFLALVTTGTPLPMVMQRFTVIADAHSLHIHFRGYGGEREDVALSDGNGTLTCGGASARIHLIWKADGAGASTLDLMKASDGSIAVRAREAGDTYEWYRFWPDH
jgi:hypothetical protein